MKWFRNVRDDESVDSRLKALSDVYTELVSKKELKNMLDSVTNVMALDEIKKIEQISEMESNNQSWDDLSYNNN